MQEGRTKTNERVKGNIKDYVSRANGENLVVVNKKLRYWICLAVIM